MHRLIFLSVILAALFLVQSCAVTRKIPMRDDPLIGSIFNATKGTRIEFKTLVEEISDHDVIYLSEKHDNPDIHAVQEKIITAFIDQGLKPTIGFEFFAMDDTPDILNFIDSGNVKHSKENEKFIENDLRKKLGWDRQSDTMWGYYYRLLNLAKENRLSAAGIDLSSARKKRITRKGIKGITSLESEQLFTTKLDDETYKAYMFDIFKAVHCGMGHGKMQERIYDTWVARNDKMAHSIVRLAAHTKGPVIVIIGGGHTEYGLGVMDRVKSMDKSIRQINVGLREVSIHEKGVEAYLSHLDLEGFDSVPPSDFIWFFQRVSYADPCEAFKASAAKMKKSPKK